MHLYPLASNTTGSLREIFPTATSVGLQCQGIRFLSRAFNQSGCRITLSRMWPGFTSMLPALLLKWLQAMKTRLAQQATMCGTGILTDFHKLWHGPCAVSTDWHKVGHGPGAALTQRHGPGITDQFNSVGTLAVDMKRLRVGEVQVTATTLWHVTFTVIYESNC